MKKYYPFLTLCSLLSATTVLAADTAASQPTMMNEVVVTAGRITEQKKQVSANISVIDREELDQAVARNLGDLFQEKGLGHVQKYPGSLTAIGIRGFRSDALGNDLQGHILVLLDGRRAGSGNVTKLLTKNIERIEIIRGPGAVQYGSAGIGGVVNIITRQGTANTAFVEAGGGSFDHAEGTVGGTIVQGAFDLAGTISYLTDGDYETGDGDRFVNSGMNDHTGISLNTGYTLAPDNRIGLILTHFEANEAGTPGTLTLNDTDDYTDQSNTSVDARYAGKSRDGKYQWLARYFFGQDENAWAIPTGSNPDGWDDGSESKNTTDQQGAQVQLTGTFAATTLTAGLDWLHYEVENSWTPEETEYANPALFLLGKSAFFNDRLTADFGLRYDWYEVEVNKPAGRSEDQNRLTPKAGLAWMATDTLKLRAQYAQGFMMPSADQLAADYVNWGSHVVGNPELDPEISTTYEAGLDYSRQAFSGSITYFYTDFEEKIIYDYLADGSRTWKNLGDATLSGFEAELSYDIGAPLGWQWEVRPYLNLTLLTKYEDDSTGQDLLYTNDANYSAGLVVNNGDGAFARFNVSYAGSQDVDDWESAVFPAPITTLESSTVADLVASYRFLDDATWGAVTVRGEIQNIFDEDYAFVKGYPMPGRSFYLGLRWDY